MRNNLTHGASNRYIGCHLVPKHSNLRPARTCAEQPSYIRSQPESEHTAQARRRTRDQIAASHELPSRPKARHGKLARSGAGPRPVPARRQERAVPVSRGPGRKPQENARAQTTTWNKKNEIVKYKLITRSIVAAKDLDTLIGFILASGADFNYVNTASALVRPALQMFPISTALACVLVLDP